MKSPVTKLFVALAGLLLSAPGYCTVIASYDFDGATPFASKDSDPMTTASSFLSQATGANSSGFGQVVVFPAGGSNALDVWSAEAERDATSTFFEFSIALSPGTSSVYFDRLTFDAGVRDTLAGTTRFDYNLLWSVDGFVAPIATAFGPVITGGGTQVAQSSLSFDLSGLAPQYSGVTFRFDPVFGAGPPPSSTNGALNQRAGAVDNIVLHGTPIPEPSSVALLGIGGAFMMGIGAARRRRR